MKEGTANAGEEQATLAYDHDPLTVAENIDAILTPLGVELVIVSPPEEESIRLVARRKL